LAIDESVVVVTVVLRMQATIETLEVALGDCRCEVDAAAAVVRCSRSTWKLAPSGGWVKARRRHKPVASGSACSCGPCRRWLAYLNPRMWSSPHQASGIAGRGEGSGGDLDRRSTFIFTSPSSLGLLNRSTVASKTSTIARTFFCSFRPTVLTRQIESPALQSIFGATLRDNDFPRLPLTIA